ncbi:S41 family peptidase [Pedobacter deserti]|uniref:S41 family peptidase n=1 Tax=Pedobacter deserti TaxID=2817382 RepID=UPI00210AF8BB|nr:S41 family peptidase [Pedobacter sp. SYSU D00382]
MFYAFSLPAQVPRHKSTDLKRDLEYLEDSLRANYPSLYRYHTRGQIDRKFSVLGRMGDSISALTFLADLRHLISSLKDGHMYVGLTPALKSYLKKEALYFPLRLYLESGRTLIAADRENQIGPGTELLRIDGIPVSQIRARLYGFISGDGSITTKKRLVLNNVFHFYYLMAYGARRSFTVTLKMADGDIKTRQIAAVPENLIPAAPVMEDKRKLLELTIGNDDVALLRIGSFDLNEFAQAGLDFPVFLDNVFHQLAEKNIQKLIIDLRGNGGGRDLYGAMLYRYLADRPFRYYQALYASTLNLPYREFAKGNSSFNDLQPAMLKPVNGGYRLDSTAHDNLKVQQPVARAYTGKVVFISDGLTFSTAAEFCAVAKAHKRGIFVGEETGGTAVGNTSGNSKEIILPVSQLTVSYGLIRYHVTDPQGSRRGVVPDYSIGLTLQDLLTQHDAPMEVAKRLINSRSK